MYLIHIVLHQTQFKLQTNIRYEQRNKLDIFLIFQLLQCQLYILTYFCYQVYCVVGDYALAKIR